MVMVETTTSQQKKRVKHEKYERQAAYIHAREEDLFKLHERSCFKQPSPHFCEYPKFLLKVDLTEGLPSLGASKLMVYI